MSQKWVAVLKMPDELTWVRPIEPLLKIISSQMCTELYTCADVLYICNFKHPPIFYTVRCIALNIHFTFFFSTKWLIYIFFTFVHMCLDLGWKKPNTSSGWILHVWRKKYQVPQRWTLHSQQRKGFCGLFLEPFQLFCMFGRARECFCWIHLLFTCATSNITEL